MIRFQNQRHQEEGQPRVQIEVSQPTEIKQERHFSFDPILSY